jgi:hypothetical protein
MNTSTARNDIASRNPPNWKSGFAVGYKGIYLCTRELFGRNSHVFAAREDMNIKHASGRNVGLIFPGAAIELGQRGEWLGHECARLDWEHYEEQLSQGLRDGSVFDKWVIPTREMLCGEDDDGDKVWPENLYDLRNTGDFKDKRFTMATGNSDIYGSCTEMRDSARYVSAALSQHGIVFWVQKLQCLMSYRTVRVELAL